MGPPPAKRRKRLVVSSSEDEEGDLAPPEGRGDQPRTNTTSNGVDNNRSNAQVLSTRLRSGQAPPSKALRVPPAGPGPPEPEKKTNRQSTTVRNTAKATALDTYFSTDRSLRHGRTSGERAKGPRKATEEDDFIEDDAFDEELRRLFDSRKGIRGESRETPAPSQSHDEKGASRNLPTGSQVFRELGNNVRKRDTGEKAFGSKKQDKRPWADRYGPTSVAELSVHKKKVADVRDWLDAVCYGRSKKKLLILKGASGVGKTATISTLAKTMDLDVLEWKNPTVSDFSSGTYVSTSAQFEEFLGRGGKFASLEVAGGEDSSGPHRSYLSEETNSDCTRKIILIEEFPNISMSGTTSLELFRASVLRYISTNQAFMSGTTSNINASENSRMPLVMIITETQVNSLTSVGDSFTAHRLLGADILSHPSTDMIEFNPIASTYISKALNLVIQKEARDSGRRRVPGPSVISCLSEIGDVRSAIGSLEFLCLKGQDGEDWGGRVASKGKKGAKNAAILTKMEEQSLKLVTQRDMSLGLFHAVGKVVYNKRGGPAEGESPFDPPPQPPKHLPEHARLKPPGVSIDDLADETGTDTQTFIAALHENYVLSCTGNEFSNSLNGCIEYLSDTDVLIPERGWRSRGNANVPGGTTDSLRQDEITFQVAVRGLLFGLPCPVTRGGLGELGLGKGGGKGDAFRMFYPASMRLGRQAVEIEAMVEKCMRRWRRAGSFTGSLGAGVGDDEHEDGVASWAKRMSTSRSGYEGADTTGSTITPSKDAMISDILPYTAMIERSRPGSRSIEELDRITGVTGNIQPVIDDSLEDMDTTAPVKERPPPARTGTGAATAVEQAISHLYLSDDDIED